MVVPRDGEMEGGQITLLARRFGCITAGNRQMAWVPSRSVGPWRKLPLDLPMVELNSSTLLISESLLPGDN